jgi:hypothetical protein
MRARYCRMPSRRAKRDASAVGRRYRELGGRRYRSGCRVRGRPGSEHKRRCQATDGPATGEPGPPKTCGSARPRPLLATLPGQRFTAPAAGKLAFARRSLPFREFRNLANHRGFCRVAVPSRFSAGPPRAIADWAGSHLPSPAAGFRAIPRRQSAQSLHSGFRRPTPEPSARAAGFVAPAGGSGGTLRETV